jgi:DNA repair protein RadA/Sms
VGLFEMTDAGMEGVADPSGLFLGDRRAGVAGSAVVTSVEGRRPLVVEVQALVGRAAGATARRATQGVDAGRVALLLAVLDRLVEPAIGADDVFVSAVGGARLTEPAADLGIALALMSAATGVPLPPEVVAVGEVGLAGEVRLVPHLPWRLGEAARLGFRVAVAAAGTPETSGLDLVRVGTLQDALLHFGLPLGGDGTRKRGRPGRAIDRRRAPAPPTHWRSARPPAATALRPL